MTIREQRILLGKIKIKKLDTYILSGFEGWTGEEERSQCIDRKKSSFPSNQRNISEYNEYTLITS